MTVKSEIMRLHGVCMDTKNRPRLKAVGGISHFSFRRIQNYSETTVVSVVVVTTAVSVIVVSVVTVSTVLLHSPCYVIFISQPVDVKVYH